MDANNYGLPPMPPPVPEGHSEIRVDGKKIFGMDPVVLPPVCVKCGEDAAGGKAIKKNLVYVPGWTYVFLLAGVLPAAIVMMALQKKAKVTYHLCRAHLVRRRWVVWSCATLWLLTPALFITGIAMEVAWVLAGSGIAFALALIMSIVVTATTPVRLSGFEDPYFYVAGPKKPFVEHCRTQFGDLQAAYAAYAAQSEAGEQSVSP